MQKTFNLRMDYIIMGNTVGQIEHLCYTISICATQSFPAIVFLSCLFVLMQKTFNLRMDYIMGIIQLGRLSICAGGGARPEVYIWSARATS